MASTWLNRASRPLAGALGVVPLLKWQLQPTGCDEKPKPAFHPATCVKNEAHTHDTRKITLQLGSSWNQQGPIANVAVKANLDGGKSVTRPYNPLSTESGDQVTLLVKKYDGAQMGTALHSLKEGDTVEVKGPNRQWPWKKGEYQEYVMVAGGTGITPLFQAAQHILNNDSASVTFLTFNKTPEDVLLKKELAELGAQYPGRLQITHFVEGGKGHQQAGCEQAGRGCMPRVLKENMPPPGNGLKILVCGRPPMTAHVAGPKTKDYKQGELAGVLKELGYESQHVWKV